MSRSLWQLLQPSALTATVSFTTAAKAGSYINRNVIGQRGANGIWSVLASGSAIHFTATRTVTQGDIDYRQ